MQIENERVGLICATLANVNRDAKKHPKAYKPSDFVHLDKKAQPKKNHADQLEQFYNGMMAIAGAK